MKDINTIVKQLIKYDSEEEWFEFKENWFNAKELGMYISSLSNAAALKQKEAAYFVWGIDNKTHEMVGTTFNYQRDIKGEPLQHYLARQTSPEISFSFEETLIENKRVVVLTVPCAKEVPTAFDGERYIRIGSSKVNLKKYPQREIELFRILRDGFPTIVNTESEYQDLSFEKLFTYYAGKGVSLRQNTFKKNLKLLTPKGKYNIMAQLLSDDSHIPVRVAIFAGDSKASPMYSVKEFGYTCLLLTVDKILEYGDVLNIPQADERNRIVERLDVPLFDADAFREAIINAFLHNAWISGNEPMVTIYSNRIEILSRGTIGYDQTMEGFFEGESKPVNKELSDIFLQLHISERTGRGVPVITGTYGREAFEFRQNSIVVTIPFNRINAIVGDKVVDKVGDKMLNTTRQRIMEEIRNNPNITHPQLMMKIGIGKTAIQNNISYLRKNGYIERVGSNKTGYWKIIEETK
ncbi:MAG: putative DNA binding domain-containing protein [Firmicutes bacterium]|nr:putative DNA binding domain-containing protein [Bacillota bacterium]